MSERITLEDLNQAKKAPYVFLEELKSHSSIAPLIKGTVRQGIHDLLHFFLAAGIVGPVQDCLLLLPGHGGVGVHGVEIPGQGHAEADGDLIEIHSLSSRCHLRGLLPRI